MKGKKEFEFPPQVNALKDTDNEEQEFSGLVRVCSDPLFILFHPLS